MKALSGVRMFFTKYFGVGHRVLKTLFEICLLAYNLNLNLPALRLSLNKKDNGNLINFAVDAFNILNMSMFFDCVYIVCKIINYNFLIWILVRIPVAVAKYLFV